MARTRAPSVDDSYIALMSLIRTEVEDDDLKQRLTVAVDNLQQSWLQVGKTTADMHSRMLRAR